MEFNSINPYTNKVIGSYKGISDDELNQKLVLAQNAQKKWQKLSLKERCNLMLSAAQVLRDNLDGTMP